MAWETLNLGTSANSGDGNDLRTAFTIVNNNLNYLKTSSITTLNVAGDGIDILEYTPNSNILNARKLKNGMDIAIGLDSDGSVVISSTARVSSDTAPTLSGNLNTGTFEIHHYADGKYQNLKLNDIIIKRNVANTEAIISSDIPLRIIANDSIISIDSNVFAKTISATNITGPTNGLHTGNVSGNVTGNLTGSSTGLHTGNVIGNVTGTVSDISNHSLKALIDVSDDNPTTNDILRWDGTQYKPASLSAPLYTTVEIQALSAHTGMIVFNTDTNKFQGYNNTTWVDIA